MKAAFLEVANDALGSLAVIVAAGAEWAFSWTRADAIASLLMLSSWPRERSRSYAVLSRSSWKRRPPAWIWANCAHT